MRRIEVLLEGKGGALHFQEVALTHELQNEIRASKSGAAKHTNMKQLNRIK